MKANNVFGLSDVSNSSLENPRRIQVYPTARIYEQSTSSHLDQPFSSSGQAPAIRQGLSVQVLKSCSFFKVSIFNQFNQLGIERDNRSPNRLQWRFKCQLQCLFDAKAWCVCESSGYLSNSHSAAVGSGRNSPNCTVESKSLLFIGKISTES